MDCRIPNWTVELFDALDAGDVETYCSFYRPESTFIYANEATLEGIEEVRAFVQQFVDQLEGSDHTLDEVYSSPGRTIVRGEVAYVLEDGSTLEGIPFVDVFECVEGAIDVCQVYVDQDL